MEPEKGHDAVRQATYAEAGPKELLEELEERARRDFQRMRRWRHVHRLLGVLFTVSLIAVPPLLAFGVVEQTDSLGKGLLLGMTLVAALNAAFEPLTHSQRRRASMNAGRRLYDHIRAARLAASTDDASLLEVFEDFADRFADLYAARGKGLLDADLSAKGRADRQKPGRSTNLKAPS